MRTHELTSSIGPAEPVIFERAHETLSYLNHPTICLVDNGASILSPLSTALPECIPISITSTHYSGKAKGHLRHLDRDSLSTALDELVGQLLLSSDSLGLVVRCD